jgi:hypothetical protein
MRLLNTLVALSILACSIGPVQSKAFHAFGRSNPAEEAADDGQKADTAAAGSARREPAPRIEAVFCRYSENVEWLFKLPKTDFRYIVHDKGGAEHPLNTTGMDKSITTVITLPNIGTEVRHAFAHCDSLDARNTPL